MPQPSRFPLTLAGPQLRLQGRPAQALLIILQGIAAKIPPPSCPFSLPVRGFVPPICAQHGL